MVEDYRLGGVMVMGGQDRCETLLDVERFSLRRATLLIKAVQLLGQLCGSLRRLRQEELDNIVGHIHTASCIDPRRYPEPDIRRRRRATHGQIGDTEELPEAGLNRVGELAKTKQGKIAVFTDEGYGVGDRCDRYQFEEGGKETPVQAQELSVRIWLFGHVREEQGVSELEGDRCSAQGLEGVGTSGLRRVENRDSLWQRG